jgi:hypothetical protein
MSIGLNGRINAKSDQGNLCLQGASINRRITLDRSMPLPAPIGGCARCGKRILLLLRRQAVGFSRTHPLCLPVRNRDCYRDYEARKNRHKYAGVAVGVDKVLRHDKRHYRDDDRCTAQRNGETPAHLEAFHKLLHDYRPKNCPPMPLPECEPGRACAHPSIP